MNNSKYMLLKAYSAKSGFSVRMLKKDLQKFGAKIGGRYFVDVALADAYYSSLIAVQDVQTEQRTEQVQGSLVDALKAYRDNR